MESSGFDFHPIPREHSIIEAVVARAIAGAPVSHLMFGAAAGVAVELILHTGKIQPQTIVCWRGGAPAGRLDGNDVEARAVRL
jgi:hypothetical protein